jgi:ParB/RepB/Spo0J family partition protein
MKQGTATAKTNGSNGHVAASVVAIPLDRIIPSTLAPQEFRRGHFEKGELTELAASLKEQGQLQAIIVRHHKTKKGYFELIAGERRFLASKLNKAVTIDASIRDLSDDAVVQVQLQENLQRKAVAPLDEALSYKWLLDHAKLEDKGGVMRPYAVADISAKFAQSEKLIVRRLKLVDLCPYGKKELSEGRLPLAHAELLARFPEAEQNRMFNDKGWHAPIYSHEKLVKPIAETRKLIDQHYLRNLAKAVFDREDATLNPTAGACTVCPKRSSANPALFAEDFGKEDKCPDGKCWTSKLVAHYQRLREAIAIELPNPKKIPLAKLANTVPLIKDAWTQEVVMLQAPRIVKFSSYEPEVNLVAANGTRCPKTEKGLWISGDKVGKAQLICTNKSCKLHKRSSSSSSTDSWKLQQQERNVDEKIKLRSNAVLVELASLIASKAKTPLHATEAGERLLLLALVDMDWNVREFMTKGKLWPEGLKDVEFYSSGKVQAAIKKLDRDTVVKTIATLLYAWNITDTQTADRPRMAKFVGLDVDILEAEAAVELAPNAALRTAAHAHLEKVKKGQKSKRPAFYWPKPKEVAKPKAKPVAKKKTAVKKGGTK